MRIVIALAIAAILSIAQAVTLPPDATMFVTDDDGVIVGVGRSHGGETFVLDVIATYQGFARLVIVTSDGDVVVHDVVVTEGTVLLELVDLRAIARRAGFVAVFVEAIDVVDTADRHLPAGAPGSERDAAPHVGQPGSVGAPSQPADAPAPVSPVPASPVVGPADPPAGLPDTPAGPPVAPDPPIEPGPPASTPGRPDGPPAHGPGGIQGNGPPGPAAPQPDAEEGDVEPEDDQPGPPGQGRRP